MNADEYHKLAEVEDRMWYFRALHAHVERELREALPGRAAVLDAGCGTGGLMVRLAPRHTRWSWAGVDISELACTLATERVGREIEIRRASVTELPFEDGRFDAVVSADVLYHIDDDGAALREYFRVLKPGGVVVLNVPAYRWLWSYHDVAVHSKRRYGRGELLSKLGQAGFEERRATYWNTLPFPLVVARRKLFPAPATGSDVHLFPAPLEAAFNAAMAMERGWLRLAGRLPFGTSVFAVAKKAG